VKTAEPLGVVIFLSGLEGIHGSCQISIFSPVPTLHTYPLLNVARPAMMLYQVKEEPILGPALRISPWGKYFALKTFAQRDSGSLIILQICFANIARLNEWKSRKPIPPSLLG
jgi:hypothetical protein